MIEAASHTRFFTISLTSAMMILPAVLSSLLLTHSRLKQSAKRQYILS